jgi:hypothetical protein
MSFIVAPRLGQNDTTWQGQRLLDPGWMYIALSRGQGRCYLFAEDLTEGRLEYKCPEKKRKRWLIIQEMGKIFWDGMQLDPSCRHPISESSQLPQMFGSSNHLTDQFRTEWTSVHEAVQVMVADLASH